MMMQMNRPRIVPNHTLMFVNDEQNREVAARRTYLTLELFVSGEITVMAEGLLQESQQHGDNDACL